MRVAVYHSNSDIRIEERDRPVPGPGELLMRVEASGICGSDLMEWYRRPKAPLVLGHEVAGVIEEVGEAVDRFARGERIVTTHHVPCNTCRYCLTDRHSVCDTLHTTTFDPGGFAEYVRLPAINVDRGTFRLADHVSFEEGSFVEPLACAIRSQRVAGVRVGDSVAVLGSGVSGILQIQVARALGAGRVVATDVSEDRLAMASRFGADAVLDARSDLAEPFDRVLVCTASRAAMEQALRIVDRGGAVLYFAPLGPDESLSIPALDLWKRGVSIVHSYAGPPADMLAALELIATKRVDVAGMVSHRLDLADTQKGFRLMTEGGASLKVIIEPRR